MAWTTPRTWVSGELVTASLLNTHIRDNLASLGLWTAVTFSAGNFTASGAMTWTLTSGDVALNRYMLLGAGKFMVWHVALITTTVAGAASNFLKIAVPTGAFFSTSSVCPVAYFYDNGTLVTCNVAPFDSSHIGISKTDGSNFNVAGTNATYCYFVWVGEMA